MTVSIDELGPVDWIVVEFAGTKLTGEIAPIIKDYTDRGLIKVLDLVFLKKDGTAAWRRSRPPIWATARSVSCAAMSGT